MGKFWDELIKNYNGTIKYHIYYYRKKIRIQNAYIVRSYLHKNAYRHKHIEINTKKIYPNSLWFI